MLASGVLIGYISLAVSCDFFWSGLSLCREVFLVWIATIDFLLIHQDGSGPDFLGKHG